MPRRRVLRAAAGGAAAVAVLGIGGCAGLGGPTVITLGEPELQRLLARPFPQQRRLLEVLQVELAAPALALQPERNRLGLTLTATAQDRLTHRPLRGELSFDTALRYEPGDASVRLNQVRVQRLRRLTDVRPDGSPPLPPGAEGLLAGLGAAVAERMLEDLAIYRLTPERQADLRRLGLTPGAVTVTARGVEITLARRP